MSNKNKKLKSNSIANISISNDDVSFLNNNKSFESKKITIRDLCPEEKLKIGELLKKLADEKEAKEKLQKEMEEDKRKYEMKLYNVSKEKDNLSNSNMNNHSFCLRSESFTENFLGKERNFKQDERNVNLEIKNLREKFNNMLDTIKKSANKHESFLNRLSNSKIDPELMYERREIKNSLLEISTNSSMLREEQPLILDVNQLSNEIYESNETKEENSMINTIQDDTLKDNKNLIVKANLEKGSGLQNSILNINEDFRENSIENFLTENINFKIIDPNLSNKKNSYLLSTKKLQDLRTKLYNKTNDSSTSVASISNNYIIPELNVADKRENNLNKSKESTYKQMLNRVREKSQEQAMKMEIFSSKKNGDKHKIPYNFNYNKNLVSIKANNFQIASNSDKKYSKDKSENNLEFTFDQSKSIRSKIDLEDEQLISILNTNSSSKSDFTTLRKKQDFKGSSLETKCDFYEENLFDLIDEIESKENLTNIQIQEGFKNIPNKNKIFIDYEIDKRISSTMKEVEEDLNKITEINHRCDIQQNNFKSKDFKYSNHSKNQNNKFTRGKDIHGEINLLNYKYN